MPHLAETILWLVEQHPKEMFCVVTDVQPECAELPEPDEPPGIDLDVKARRVCPTRMRPL
ncbi:MAG: hypothetical protein EOO40_00610 [Deltaproteobacteria bacterium]|nr:MAG: hypothetical protein EOO40_00610 [Deltaproteobacteria bacterium]